MTVRAFVDKGDPTRIDLHNKIDPKTGVRYLGRAWCDVSTGRWLCLADVGSLCVVEVRLVVSGDGQPSDPDDEPPSLRVVVDPAQTPETSDTEETMRP